MMNPFDLGELLEDVFLHLDLTDLANLRLTSKEGRDAVDNFATNYLSRRKRNQALIEFYKSSFNCLLPFEKEMFDASRRNIGNIFLRLRLSMEIVKDGTVRFPVEQADCFHHLDNPSYIVRQEDSKLQRKVVYLKNVCWLLFNINLGFQKSGSYRVRMRYKVANKYRGQNSEEPGEVSVNQVSGESSVKIVSERIGFNSWSKLAEQNGAESILEHSRIEPSTDDWMYFVMPFALTVDSELRFDFNDTVNPWWKSGMFWDFVELQRVC